LQELNHLVLENGGVNAFSEKIKLSAPFVSMILRGKSRVSASFAKKIDGKFSCKLGLQLMQAQATQEYSIAKK
jgi:hypothetical protein